jgi:hypothetical protein
MKILDIGTRRMKLKARLLMRGDRQPEDSWEELYAPVAGMEVMKSIIIEGFVRGMKVKQFDIKTAFLNADIDVQNLYMKTPPGYPEYDEEGNEYVWWIRKSIYGSKQAARLWYLEVSKTLMDAGYKQSVKEPCVFYKVVDGKLIVIGLWVDDMVAAADEEEMIDEVATVLKKKYKLHELGDVRYILGIEVIRTSSKLVLSQESYLKDVLKFYDMNNYSLTIPFHPRLDLSSDGPEPNLSINIRQAIGKLSWLANGTRPDIAYAVNLISSYQDKAKKVHVKAVKQLLQYLVGSQSRCMEYRIDQKETPIFACSDATLGGDEGRASRTGYCIFRGGAAMLWKTRVQGTKADNTAETEYYAGSNCLKKLLWLNEFFGEIGWKLKLPILIQVDNTAVVQLAYNKGNRSKLAHIEIKWEILKQKVSEGIVRLEHVRSDCNPADALTKPLEGDRFLQHRNTMMGRAKNEQYSLSKSWQKVDAEPLGS